ncbi:MAG: DNA-3-methyladenine glycosylase I, partial [Methyloligellaceae bacterium]
MVPFAEIREIAAKRKGGEDILEKLLRDVTDNEALSQIPDSRVLAEMTKRIFSAGFVWRVIEVKWSGFEEAFLEFKPERLVFQPDEFWDALA